MNQRRVNSVAIGYMIPGLFMVALSCLFPQKWICTVFFLIALGITLCFKKRISSIIGFCVICLINRQILIAPLYPGAGISLMSLVMVIIVLFSLYSFINVPKMNKEKYVVPPVFVLLWVLYRIVNGLLTGGDNVLSGVWSCVPLMLCIVAQYYCLRYKKFYSELFTSIIVGCSIVVIVGYVELLLGRTFYYSLWKYDVYRYGVLRVGSTLADPNFMAMIDILFIPLLFTDSAKALFSRRYINVFKILAIIQVVLSFSRTAIVILPLCIFMSMILKKKGRALLFIPLLVLSVFFVPVALDLFLSWGDASMLTSTSSRLKVVESAVNLWTTSPLIGFGNGGFYLNSASLIGTVNVNTMNTPVQILVEYGLVGIGFYIMYIVIIIKNVLNYSRNSTLEKRISYNMFIVSLFGWILMSFSLDAFQLVGFWIFPALIMMEHNTCFERKEVKV